MASIGNIQCSSDSTQKIEAATADAQPKARKGVAMGTQPHAGCGRRRRPEPARAHTHIHTHSQRHASSTHMRNFIHSTHAHHMARPWPWPWLAEASNSSGQPRASEARSTSAGQAMGAAGAAAAAASSSSPSMADAGRRGNNEEDPMARHIQGKGGRGGGSPRGVVDELEMAEGARSSGDLARSTAAMVKGRSIRPRQRPAA